MTAAAPDAFAFRFSTDDLPPAERLPFFREVIGRSIVKLDMEPLGDGPYRFDAVFQALPGLGIASIASSAVRVTRTADLIAGDGSDDLVLSMPISGRTRVAQLGRDFDGCRRQRGLDAQRGAGDRRRPIGRPPPQSADALRGARAGAREIRPGALRRDSGRQRGDAPSEQLRRYGAARFPARHAGPPPAGCQPRPRPRRARHRRHPRGRRYRRRTRRARGAPERDQGRHRRQSRRRPSVGGRGSARSGSRRAMSRCCSKARARHSPGMFSASGLRVPGGCSTIRASPRAASPRSPSTSASATSPISTAPFVNATARRRRRCAPRGMGVKTDPRAATMELRMALSSRDDRVARSAASARGHDRRRRRHRRDTPRRLRSLAAVARQNGFVTMSAVTARTTMYSARR